jgi:hypothetical protein
MRAVPSRFPLSTWLLIMKYVSFLSPLGAAVALLAVVPAHAGFLNACSDGSTKGASGICTAPTSTVINAPGGKRRSDTFFMGINWNFGTKAPELVLGVRSLRTGVNKNSSGAQLDVFLPFLGGISFDRIRLSYVGGKRSVLGQLGFGYSFSQQTPLVGVGVQVPYANFGLDYLFRGTALPYVGLNSLNRPKTPTGGASSTTYNCTDGVLTPSADFFFDNESIQTLDNLTCYDAQQPT